MRLCLLFHFLTANLSPPGLFRKKGTAFVEKARMQLKQVDKPAAARPFCYYSLVESPHLMKQDPDQLGANGIRATWHSPPTNFKGAETPPDLVCKEPNSPFGVHLTM